LEAKLQCLRELPGKHAIPLTRLAGSTGGFFMTFIKCSDIRQTAYTRVE
jgi:hypothetical protein